MVAAKTLRQPKADPEPQPLNREEGVTALGHLASFLVGQVSKIDGVTIAIHTPPIAKACADTAANDPKFAEVLDKFLRGGPYAMLFAALMPLGMQLAANHKMLVKAGELGTKTPEELLAIGQVMTTQPEEDKVSTNGDSPA